MKEKTKIFCDILLYDNRLEGLIKITFWLISWIVGIAVMVGAADTDKRTLASAFLIFSLSLLMEFAPQINKKTKLAGTIIHGLFCTALIAILLLSFTALTYNNTNPEDIEKVISFINIMFAFSIAVVIYMSTNFVLILLFAETKTNNESNNGLTESESEYLKLFDKKLKRGPLGDL